MKTCPRCKAQVEDTIKFCGSCGSAIDAPAAGAAAPAPAKPVMKTMFVGSGALAGKPGWPPAAAKPAAAGAPRPGAPQRPAPAGQAGRWRRAAGPDRGMRPSPASPRATRPGRWPRLRVRPARRGWGWEWGWRRGWAWAWRRGWAWAWRRGWAWGPGWGWRLRRRPVADARRGRDADAGDGGSRTRRRHDAARPRGRVRCSTTENLVGFALNNRYKVESKIGEGGFGAVYRGVQIATGPQGRAQGAAPAR